MSTVMLEKARHAWSPCPDWVEELATLADMHGLTPAASKIKYSPAVVSTVISNTYRGNLGKVEQRVRGALMGSIVDCPEQGEMRRDVCLDWQGKPFAATSSNRVRMFHACRGGCPHSRHTKGGSHE